MAQRNILAGFKMMSNAKKAVKELHDYGLTELQIDRISPYPGEGIESIQNPISGQIDSLTDLTLDGEITNKSAGILNAVSEDASGLSDGSPFEKDPNILLTVVANEDKATMAKNIIEKHGGTI